MKVTRSFKAHFDGVSIKIIDELPGASVEIDGIKFVTLEKLIKRLDADFALKLDPYVRAKYLELEEAVRNSESSQEK